MRNIEYPLGCLSTHETVPVARIVRYRAAVAEIVLALRYNRLSKFTFADCTDSGQAVGRIDACFSTTAVYLVVALVTVARATAILSVLQSFALPLQRLLVLLI